jgi:hypothetical protein
MTSKTSADEKVIIRAWTVAEDAALLSAFNAAESHDGTRTNWQRVATALRGSGVDRSASACRKRYMLKMTQGPAPAAWSSGDDATLNLHAARTPGDWDAAAREIGRTADQCRFRHAFLQYAGAPVPPRAVPEATEARAPAPVSGAEAEAAGLRDLVLVLERRCQALEALVGTVEAHLEAAVMTIEAQKMSMQTMYMTSQSAFRDGMTKGRGMMHPAPHVFYPPAAPAPAATK